MRYNSYRTKAASVFARIFAAGDNLYMTRIRGLHARKALFDILSLRTLSFSHTCYFCPVLFFPFLSYSLPSFVFFSFFPLSFYVYYFLSLFLLLCRFVWPPPPLYSYENKSSCRPIDLKREIYL